MEESNMALKLIEQGNYEDALPGDIQLMRQCLNTFAEMKNTTHLYSKEQAYVELEKIANGELYWKMMYLKDQLWDAPNKIEILTNPIHMAIILGLDNLALQIYERYSIAYEKEDLVEVVRYSTMKGNRIQRFSAVDVFVAFASAHVIWKKISERILKEKKNTDEIIFNNVFLQYSKNIEFPITDDMEHFLIEKIRVMDGSVPEFFLESTMKIKYRNWLLDNQEFTTVLQKISIFLEAFKESGSVAEKYMEFYVKKLFDVYLDDDIHYNIELNVLMERLEKLCDFDERLSRLFSGLLLILATKQARNIDCGETMIPYFILESENAATEGALDPDYFIEWAKKRQLNYTMRDYYLLVKKLDLDKEFVIRMTDILYSILTELDFQ